MCLVTPAESDININNFLDIVVVLGSIESWSRKVRSIQVSTTRSCTKLCEELRLMKITGKSGIAGSADGGWRI